MNRDKPAEIRFRLVDVDCTSASCNHVLGRCLGKAKGVIEFYVNPMDSMLTVRFDPRATTAAEVEALVRATGFRTIGPIMAKGAPRSGGVEDRNPGHP